MATLDLDEKTYALLIATAERLGIPPEELLAKAVEAVAKNRP